jgi:putative transposase
MALWKKNRRVYGARKLHKAARRGGIDVGRDQVATVMRKAGISGVKRGKKRRTTWTDETAERPADLVDRKFSAPTPNRLWVADITYVPTWSGFAYVAFVTDVYSRAIVGWKVSSSLSADLALDALEMAIWRRKGDLSKLVHHSDRGVQYLSIRYSERLADIEAAASVGSKGDSYDNALAESTNGLYKTECVGIDGPFRTVGQVELATASWVEWFNAERLHSFCGDVPPEEYEAAYYAAKDVTDEVA